MIRGSQSKSWVADINIGERSCEFDNKTEGNGQPVLNKKDMPTEEHLFAFRYALSVITFNLLFRLQIAESNTRALRTEMEDIISFSAFQRPSFVGEIQRCLISNLIRISVFLIFQNTFFLQ